MSLDAERKQWEKEALAEPLPPGIKCTSTMIGGVECVWMADEGSHNAKVLVYLHGGGLVAGSAVTHQHFAATLATRLNISVLLVNYRLLPEHEYPAPLEDVLSVYRALITTHSYQAKQLIVGGDSSGAGLALAALVCLRDEGVALPAKAFLVSGTFDMTLTSDSMQRNTCTDQHLSPAALKRWQADYLNYDLRSPLLSPLYADLSHLPPLLLIAGGEEPWVSDSRSVAKKIGQQEGEAILRIWSNMGHVFIMNTNTRESEEALDEMTDFILS